MAEQCPPSNECQTDNKDRGLFDCFGKEDEEPKEDVPMADAEEQHKPSLMEKLQRSNSGSSSSSEEEVEEDGVKVKRKKKKRVIDKIKEKLTGEKGAGTEAEQQTLKANADQGVHPVAEEKKGFMDQIKEKIPGHHKLETPAVAPAPTPALAHCDAGTGASPQEHKEKKGIFEKIMEKFPGAHKDGDEAKNEHH